EDGIRGRNVTGVQTCALPIYWSYWMVWCVATPFFIGKISKGRTIKNVILGGYSWGLAGTYLSFIIMSGYGLNRQFTGKNNFIKRSEEHTSELQSRFDLVCRLL